MSSPSQRRLAQARLERQRTIKLADSSKPAPRVPAPILVRRGNTNGSTNVDLRSPARPTVDVQDHQIVGRAPPVAQFKMVTPPRSPITSMTQRKGSRVPLRSRSTTLLYNRPRAPALTTTSSFGQVSQPGTSMTPTRKGMPVQPHQAHLSHGTPITHKRGTLPQAWLPTSDNTNSTIGGREMIPLCFSKRSFDVEHRRTASDPIAIPLPRSGFSEYPQLSIGKRDVLVSKLKMLLKCSDVDGQTLDEWELVSPVEEIKAKGSIRRVFGVPVQESVLYASCKVILGEHTHYLPTCVFASVEEICRRGMATPALFRIAPSRNKRTLEHLTHIYNTSPTYGQSHSLADEDISNVCALLKLYLRGLPEPVFSSALWPVLCQITLGHGEPLSRIAAIQAVFRLQARSSFSLLVYLLAFLHQLVLHGAHNGLTIPILAEMFGPALFSPRNDTNTNSGGVFLSPKPEVPAMVKTFRSAGDKSGGVRVLGWILERWDSVSAGLLSLDVAREGEDVAEWSARFDVEQRRSVSSDEHRSLSSEDESDGSSSETVYSEGPPVDAKLDSDKSRDFPLPEIVSVEQVPVKLVRNSIVEVVEVPPPQSTRSSSPATLWSQETTRHRHSMSRASSTDPEPAYVVELRHRMESQEAELVDLRRELNAIRDRFVFPLPPGGNLGNFSATENRVGGPSEEETEAEEQLGGEELDEDMMPTPRPPSRPRFADLPTPTSTAAMRDLVDALGSDEPSPLFSRALRIETDGDDQGILGANVFSDLGPDTPTSDTEGETEAKLSNRSFFVANPDPKERNEGEGKKLEELYAARDALKSALAAMAPVEVQLRAVEEELQSRTS
ncbi:hypothetical protein FRC09_001688 [Ceratobasidium sp. 395]|nr:hypothetical protein FRC09_001688 [Ceratobasidium sp. 395]